MKNKFKFLATMLIGILLSTNVWGTEYSNEQFAFTSSTLATGLSTNGTFNTSYYKMSSGNTAKIMASNMFKSEILSSDNMSIVVGCGTFGSWSNPKTLKLTAQFMDKDNKELSKAEHTTTGLGGNVSYSTAFTLAKPEDPSKISYLLITFSNFNSTSDGTARLGTIKLTYSTAAAEKYTVTFNAGSGTCSTSSLTESTAGAGVNLPVASPSSACGTDGWTFAGWATASQAETTTAPTLYAANSNYKPSSDCTLYAVYSKTESGSGPTKWMVATSIAAGDVVVISTNQSYTDQAMKTAGTISNSLMGCFASTYNSDKSEITSLAGGTLQFTIGGNSTSGYTLKNGDNYLGMSGDKKVALSSTSSTWSISFSGTTATVSQLYNTSTYKLQYNYNNNNDRFTGYTSNQVAVSLYKKSSGTTTYNSNPSCATCTNLITITKGAESNGAFTLSRSGNNVCIDDDATIIVSNITPAEHYHIAAVTTTNGTVTGPADGKYTVTVTGDAMIGVTFEQDAKVTVTWVANGTTVSTVDVFPGETANAPAAPEDIPDCADAFVGWSTSTLTGTGHSAPADLFSTTSPAITEDVTYNAVFATDAGGGTVTHTMDVPQDAALSGYAAQSIPDDQGYTWSGTFSGFDNGGEKFWSLSKNQNNYHISSPTFAGNVSSIKFWVRQTASGTRSIILRSNTSAAQPTESDMGLTAAVSQNAEVQEVTITPTTQEFTQFNIYVSEGMGFRKIQVVTGGGVTYSNYVTTCATYTVTWMSNGFEIRKDENVAPGTVLTAPTVSEVKAVSEKAACGDHLVGWMPAASTTNPKVKQDTAPEGMVVGQQVTVNDNVVYHAVYADVAGE